MNIENVIFDLGGVLIQWNPQKIVSTFTDDFSLQQLLLKEVFYHQDWLDLDKGILTEPEAAAKIAERASLNVQVIFDLFVTTKQLFIQISQTVELLEAMHAHGIKLYVLSNMSKESYIYLRKTHTFFDYFDNILISGHEKLMKPDPKIFALICNRFDISPSNTLFIDDMEDNITVAKNFGLTAIQFTQEASCYKSIRKIVGLVIDD